MASRRGPKILADAGWTLGTYVLAGFFFASVAGVTALATSVNPTSQLAITCYVAEAISIGMVVVGFIDKRR